MIPMLDTHLSQLGFTESEARIYIELLKVGPQPVSVVAKRIRINRTSTYSVLRSLEKKAVVSSYICDGMKIFSANDPNCLIAYLDSKSRVLDYYKTELLSIIPKFRSLGGFLNFRRPVVRYFDGIEGVKHVMYDSLNSSNYFYSYLSINKWLDAGLGDFLVDYENFRTFDKKVSMKAIVADVPSVKSFFADYNDNSDMTELLFLDFEKFSSLFEDEMNIYDTKVSIIHLAKGEEYAVLIDSEEIATMQKTIFEMAWKGLNR